MCYVFYVNIFASLTPIWAAGFTFPGRKNPCFGRVCIHPVRNRQRLETQASPALYKVRKMPLVIITLGRTEDEQQNLRNTVWKGVNLFAFHPGLLFTLSQKDVDLNQFLFFFRELALGHWGSWEQLLSKDIPHFSLSKILFTPFSLICLSHFPVSHWRQWLPEAWE